MRSSRVLFLCCAMASSAAIGQSSRGSAGSAPLELSYEYSYLHANAGPSQCGCFNMNGGNTEAAVPVYSRFSAVADLTGERASNVNNGMRGLSLLSFTAGPRLSYPLHPHSNQPYSNNHEYVLFAQSLFGVVHGFDSYFPVTSGATGAANSFALLAGGGLDIRISGYIAIRPIQADYFLTRLPNGVNHTQNNLRLSAGVVLRIW